MFGKPQKQHAWLDQLTGNWTTDSECQTPDGSVQKTTGKLMCRTLGGMWLVMEGSGMSPEGGEWSTIMTLGFDPAKANYNGTFIGSMMFHLWLYQGKLDGSQTKLILDTEGPKFEGNGTTKYQDSIEIVDKDHWILSSKLRDDDGKWVQFMTAHHHRSN